MIVENVPSSFLLLEEPTCVFSDDSRFIYMLMSWVNPLSISVYDVIYNKFITLLPDTSVTDLLNRLQGYKEETVRPSILSVNNSTLLILFNENESSLHSDTALLTVVHLNFSANTFSIADHKIIHGCDSSGPLQATLVKNDNKFLIVHTFLADPEEYDSDKFLAYYTFFLHDDRILEVQKNRTIFNFDYRSSGHLGTWYICNNKLWVIRKVGRTLDYQLLYFDLNEASPKEIPVEIFRASEFQIMFQWSDNFLLKFFEDDGEFAYFDLTTSQKSKLFQRSGLERIESTISDLKRFVRFDTFGTSARFARHFDCDFNALIIDKTKRQLFKVPFRTPPNLLDIAWNAVLNNGLLNELDKRKIVIYPKLF